MRFDECSFEVLDVELEQLPLVEQGDVLIGMIYLEVFLAFEIGVHEETCCWMRLLERMIRHLVDYVKLVTYLNAVAGGVADGVG